MNFKHFKQKYNLLNYKVSEYSSRNKVVIKNSVDLVRERTMPTERPLSSDYGTLNRILRNKYELRF
jgi:hypothetical protein